MIRTLFICYCLGYLNLLAQTLDSSHVSMGSPYPERPATQEYRFEKDEIIFCLKLDGHQLTVQKSDFNTLNLIQENILEDFLPNNAQTEEVLRFSGRYYVFYTVWHTDFEELYSREIDFDAAKPVNEARLLVKTDGHIPTFEINAGTLSALGITCGKKFGFNKSFEGSKLLIRYSKESDISNDKYDVLSFHVFDDNMNKLWFLDYQLPYPQKDLRIHDFAMDSEGSVYVLLSIINYKSSLEHAELLKIIHGGKTKTKKSIDFQDKFINRAWIDEYQDGRILCAGYYTKPKTKLRTEGVFMFRAIDDTNKVTITFHKIPLDVLNQYESNGQQRKNARLEQKGKGGIDNMVLRDLGIKADGSIVLVGEQCYHKLINHGFSSNSLTVTRAQFFYLDILVSKINPDGSLAWMKKLGKRQTNGWHSLLVLHDLIYPDKGSMSYQLMADSANYYFVFLDHYKNKTLNPSQRPRLHRDGSDGDIVSYKVNDATGEASRQTLVYAKDMRRPKLSGFNIDRVITGFDLDFVMELRYKKQENVLLKLKL